MAMSKEEAEKQIADLVAKLQSLPEKDFKDYDEENTKKDFILPLFRALGWATEDRQEVTAEDKVSRRRVDYAFRIGGIPQFFLEAKPLRADLDNPQYTWQAISYARTKGVTWAVLTDFEGLRIYNAEFIGPSLQHNIFISIPYQEYLTRFDQLWLLSREACQESILDAEAEKVGKKFKRQPVDKELFEKLIEWRQMMHRQLRQYNKKYSSREIDEAVQRILDRLIFVRTAEDRELEPPTLIASVREWRENGHRKDLDVALKTVFREFDQKYDSELFEPHFSEDLTYDSTSYAQIIEGLYGMRDEVPSYLFDAIGADVMGGIYEQYLSFTQGEVELEEKRARRKKMGIYYTPQFVVKYIVENTVGRLLKEKSHEEIRNLRILDPACGSGSFLIEAFDRLDRYHQEARGTARKNDPDAQYRDYMERVRILKENIYGVDLDPQAVEIARLNLLLKTLHQRERLPKLENNIRRGNSLISGTRKELTQYFGANYEAKRPFSWEEEFPKVMKEGGFDVVIGNPPYVRIQTLDKQEVKYYDDRYATATGHYDIYALFVERGWRLLKSGGMLGFILPNKFFSASYGEGLRGLLSKEKAVSKVVDFQDAEVFATGTNYTCLLFVKKEKNQRVFYIPARDYIESKPITPNINEIEKAGMSISAGLLTHTPWVFVAAQGADLMAKLEEKGPILGQMSEKIFQGLVTGADSVYIFDGRPSRTKSVKRLYCKGLDRIVELETDLVKPLLKGSLNMRRFHADHRERYVLFPYASIEGKMQSIPPRVFKERYPLSWQYLLENRRILEGRKTKGREWYGYAGPKNLDLFDKPKLLTPAIANQASFTHDKEGIYYFVGSGGGGGGGYGIILKPQETSPIYVLGLLNSRALDWYLKQISSRFRGGYFAYNKQYIERLPIRRIDFSNPQDVKLHDRMVELVERMLELHKRLKDAVGEEKKDLERKIARADQQIDELVYELYGITEEEREIIEGKV